jgi:cytochrome b561
MLENTTATRTQPAAEAPVYAKGARRFHWWTVAILALMVPTGFIMADRGERNIWDATTNNLYSFHKLLGFIFLFVILGRLAYRFTQGAPRDEASLETWQKGLSHANHWSLYLLLLAMPIAGWIGVQLYPALNIFGLFNLPAFLTPNQERANFVLQMHKYGAIALVALVAMHVGAALYHYFIRKDGVMRRMLPGLSRRD